MDNEFIFRLYLDDVLRTTEKGDNRIFIWHSIIMKVRMRVVKIRILMRLGYRVSLHSCWYYL